jgi:5-methylcytosine-specific restriction enzyme subunit McrC
LGSTVFQQYQEIYETTSFIKGRIDTPKYIDRSLATGNWHQVPCIYDAFVMDNEFNRIVKYVATMLFHASSQQENKKYLREILFILDDVTDTSVSAEQCARIHFNPMFKDFETVRDYCTLFLQNSISFNYKNELKLFAFLLPMEYVFEDFIYGFIEKELKEVRAVSQGKSIHLDESKTFALKPDLFIQNGDQSFIADTKYKIVYSDESDPKKGISQTDLYQMLAYSVRFNVEHINLYYPDTVMHSQRDSFDITIKNTMANDKETYIHAYQLPIINRDLYDVTFGSGQSLQAMFEPLRLQLIERLRETL